MHITWQLTGDIDGLNQKYRVEGHVQLKGQIGPFIPYYKVFEALDSDDVYDLLVDDIFKDKTIRLLDEAHITLVE
jgi:hypothetical protein